MSNDPATNRKVAPDQSERDRITRELNQSMLVEAAAGTGKTTSIIDRMVALLSSGACNVETLAAVTFTRKAASEIRDRFQVALEKAYAEHKTGDDPAATQRLTDALDNQQRCFIGTIHSFCARLLRERPIEAQLEVDFQEIDEAQDAELRIRAWRTYVNQLLATDAPIVEELESVGLRLGRSTNLNRRIVNDLEELGLELPQLGAAFTKMAGFPDVVDWPATPRPLPELATGREALDDYLNHLETLDLHLMSPGSCPLIPKLNRLLLSSRHIPWREPAPTDAKATDADRQQYDRDCRHHVANFMSLLEQFDRSDRKPTHSSWPGSKADRKEMAEQERDRWVAFRDAWALPLLQAWREHRYEKVIQVLRPALDVYDRMRCEQNALNFEDLLIRARDLLRRPDMRRYFRRRVTHLLVDEFQDTDPLQAELMMLLTADDVFESDWRKCRPVPGSLFVVGDPKQSIYRFRRADIEIYLTIYQILESCASIVRLSANFRSDEAMIQWINTTFEPIFPEQATPCQASRRNLEYGGATPKVDDQVTVERSLVDDKWSERVAARQEARWIAARIQQMCQENPDLTPGDFMLLTRTRTRLDIYAEALQAAGIAHEVTGGSELNKSSELGLLRELLRAAARPDDSIALLSVLRGGLFGISDQTLYAWSQAGRIGLQTKVDIEGEQGAALQDAIERIKRYQGWLSKMPTLVAMERIADDVGLTARAAAAGPTRAGAFGKALELLRAGATDGTASDLMGRLDALVSHDEKRDGAPGMTTSQSPMRVMNLHKAKGLEAAVVILADPSGKPPRDVHMHIDRRGDDTPPRGYLAVYSGLKKGPNKWEDQQKLLACPVGWTEYAACEQEYLDAEQERLFYVAATRAGSKLICCPRESRDNPWAFFANQFPADATPNVLETYQPPAPSEPPPLPVQSPSELVRRHWDASLTPSYHAAPLKELALRGAPGKPVGADPDGAAWGSAVHTVLEVMLKSPDSDPHHVAAAALQQQRLDGARADELVQMLQQVEKSSIWQRATQSPQRYCEVPLTMVLPPALASLSPAAANEPTLVRGVIDLVFREDEHWVVVDYKSDAVSLIETQAAAQHYRGQLDAYAAAWEHLSQQPVGEKGILFTHHCRYLTT